MRVWLESETVLESDGVGEDEVHGCDFLEEVIGALIAFALGDVDPDVAGQVAALNHECAPRLATFGVSKSTLGFWLERLIELGMYRS